MRAQADKCCHVVTAVGVKSVTERDFLGIGQWIDAALDFLENSDPSESLVGSAVRQCVKREERLH